MSNKIAYAARCKCGSIVAATLIMDGHEKEIAKDVSDWIRAGYKIETLDTQTVKISFQSCRCGNDLFESEAQDE